ncbi:sporulation protein YhbH [Risungbinella massiliensis]|uniref:sporulation protein YhbH n=1 Tax=Risungbinella massiliensis TaxID=1329796 RepID=UPI0005CBA3CD|nr:sporulation protein YhbH [Risungbinella massiliensis]
MKEDFLFIVSEEDWSLHRKGFEDQIRHQEKVKEAIRENLADLVSEESVVMSDGKQVVKIPIRSLEEYRFRYNHQKGKQLGQGQGDSKVGDVLASDPAKGKKGPGKGSGAGDQAGEDYLEAEVTLEELETMLFQELELPFLVEKEQSDQTVEDIRFQDIRKKGLMGNIDKRRTLLQAIKRNALAGEKGKARITLDDLRFKTWEEKIVPHSNAVVIAMMDTSGSMGVFEKYIARSFFFWMVRFLRTKYEQVEIVFIAHHTEAKEVNEDIFFNKGESGGTICSSAYRKALEVIDERYPPSRFNIYPFHFSDGDNLTSDNERCVHLVKELINRSNLFGYGEVNQYNRHSTLMTAFRHIKDPHFLHYIIREKSQVYDSLKYFFHKREGK